MHFPCFFHHLMCLYHCPSPIAPPHSPPPSPLPPPSTNLTMPHTQVTLTPLSHLQGNKSCSSISASMTHTHTLITDAKSSIVCNYDIYLSGCYTYNSFHHLRTLPDLGWHLWTKQKSYGGAQEAPLADGKEPSHKFF